VSTLLLVRHGETEFKSECRYWGHTDVNLSALGIRQAQRLRDLLAAERIDAIYSSDLKRALVTAKIVDSKHNTGIITCAELREISFGELEGLTFDEISQRYPEIARSWIEGKLELRYPGGESLGEFIQRLSNFADRLRTLASEQAILIVAHGGSLRLLICHLLGMGPQHWHQFQLGLASLSIVETHAQGAVLRLLNNTSHLKM